MSFSIILFHEEAIIGYLMPHDPQIVNKRNFRRVKLRIVSSQVLDNLLMSPFANGLISIEQEKNTHEFSDDIIILFSNMRREAGAVNGLNHLQRSFCHAQDGTRFLFVRCSLNKGFVHGKKLSNSL